MLLVLGVLGTGYLVLARPWATEFRNERQEGGYSSRRVALSVAFFGIGELVYLGHAMMADNLSPPPTNIDGNSGGGCGGGGDGGGG